MIEEPASAQGIPDVSGADLLTGESLIVRRELLRLTCAAAEVNLSNSRARV